MYFGGNKFANFSVGVIITLLYINKMTTLNTRKRVRYQVPWNAQ